MRTRNFDKTPHRSKSTGERDYTSLERKLHTAHARQLAEAPPEPPKSNADPYAGLPFVIPADRLTIGRSFASISLDPVRAVFDNKRDYEGTKPKANDHHLVYVGAEVLYPHGRRAPITTSKILNGARDEACRSTIFTSMFEPTSVGIAGVEFFTTAVG